MIFPFKMFLAIAAAAVFCVESIAQTADEFFMLGNNAYKNGTTPALARTMKTPQKPRSLQPSFITI